MKAHLLDWQKSFDLEGFHFRSILQAETVRLFLKFRGNVKRIAVELGNTNRIPVDGKLRTFRIDNHMENSVHMAIRLVQCMGFENELEGYLLQHSDLLAEAKLRAEQGRVALTLAKRRKKV